ncbi:hypothetical protein AAC387_Pa06g1409 [Persea americana]
MAIQMSWQPHLHRRKSGQPLGLRNLGNSCYLNSVLQCLTYTPPLANFCLTNQHSSLCNSGGAGECPFCILERRIVRSLSTDLQLDAPSKIHTSLRIFAKHFRCGHQEDAHEFLRYVIDACHNTCLKLIRDRKLRNGAAPGPPQAADVAYCHDTVVKEIFGGALQSEVKCLSCGAESRKTDEMMDISLDVFQSSSLKDALGRFFQPEVLDGSNKYNCEKCKKLSAARKQMLVLRAPNILVIQLKRFEGIVGLKIDRPIAFEEVLTLSSYMCKASQDPQPEYNLFGTIVHSGYSPESGHYYAYIKDATGRWYCCNDSYVTVSSLQEVLSEKVYILFFSRANQRPKPTKTVFPHNGKKSSVSNGNAVSVNQKETVPKANGVHPSEKDTPIISSTDKVPSNQGIKFNLKRPVSKRTDANGNGTVEVHNNSSIMKHGNLKELTGTEKLKMPSKSNEESRITGKQKMQPISNGSCSYGSKSSDITDNESKQTLLPADNREIQNTGADLRKAEVHVENGYKGKLLETVKIKATTLNPSNLSGLDAASDAKLATFKEMLGKEAASGLRSFGWVDEVHSFMHARKKLCTKSVANAPNATELKKLLIADAKKTFTSQLPESLKEHLIGRLRSFTRGKELLDA